MTSRPASSTNTLASRIQPKYWATLNPISSSSQTKPIRLQKSRTVIGSMSTSDVGLQGEGVSPLHAILEWSESSSAQGPVQVLIYDLDSESGVFINGKRSVVSPLKSGDRITLGRHHFEFKIEGAEQAAARIRSLDLPVIPWVQAEDAFNVIKPSQNLTRSIEVVMSWHDHLLNVKHLDLNHPITFGESKAATFPMASKLVRDGYVVAQPMGGGFELRIPPGAKGICQTKAGTPAQVMQPDQPVLLSEGGFAKIRFGDLSYFFAFSETPPELLTQVFSRDKFAFKMQIVSLLLSIFMGYGISKLPAPLTMQVEPLPDRLATIVYQTIPKPKPKPAETPKVEPVKPTAQLPEPPKKIEIDLTKVKATELKKEIQTRVSQVKKQQAQAEASEGAGARAKGKEGMRGERNAPKAPPKAGPQTMAKRPSPNAGEGRGEGASQVLDQGNVDLLKGAASTVQNLLGNVSAKLGKGGQQLQGFGNFSTLGKGGQALSGSGSGGGGDAELLGGLGKEGRGGGRVGTGLGAAGAGNGIVGGKSRIALRLGGEGDAVVDGSIDRGAIAAALEAHRDEFRLCYERELNAEYPDLSGTVRTSFVIGSSGRVSRAGVEQSTIGNPNVDRCVVTVLKRIQFPIPSGGTEVTVRYPFRYSNPKNPKEAG